MENREVNLVREMHEGHDRKIFKEGFFYGAIAGWVAMAVVGALILTL